jgi:ADP-ribose pyrophosphatase YjhB (NUDIX family)
VTARCCLRCGARLVTVTLEGRRRRRCPRCGWTYYANPVPAAVAIVHARGRVLLARRARPPYAGTWDLPGGFLEADETPLAGLRRELREEIGAHIRRAVLVGFSTDRYGPAGFAVLTVVYRVTPVSTTFRAEDDVSEVRWFPRAAVPFREIAFPGLRRLLREHLRPARDGRAAAPTRGVRPTHRR